MHHPPATYPELVKLVGELDAPTMTRLLATHPSVHDVLEAIDGLENPEHMAYLPTSECVVDVREILVEVVEAFDAEADEREAS